MKILSEYNIKESILFFLMGFIVFSSYVSVISQEVFHLPMTMPELFFIPFLFLLKEKRKSLTFDGGLFGKYIFISLLLLGLALSLGINQPGGILSTYRSYLWLMVALCYFKNYNDITIDDIQWLAFGSLTAWFYVARYNFAFLIGGTELDMEHLSYGLNLCFPLFFAIVIYKKRYILASLGLTLSVGIFMFAGIRRVILVFLISILAIFAVQFVGNAKRIFSIAIISVALIFAYNIFADRIETYVIEVSPALYYRMYTRTENSLEGNAGGGDMTRLNNFTKLGDEGAELFLPHGIYSNHTSEKKSGSNDFPLAALIWALGLPLTAWLLGYMLIRGKKCFAYYRQSGNQETIPYLASFIVILALFFLDGTFLNYSYCAPITGMCLGKILYYSNSQNQ